MALLRWKGPDVLVVGWVPFHLKPPLAPGYPPGLGTSLLFQCGNPDPPVWFAGYPGFANWLHHSLNPLGTKEFRAALYLEGVRASFPDDKSPPRVYRNKSVPFIGYTPLRLYFGGVNVAATPPQVGQYTKGTGPLYSPTAAWDQDGRWVELRYRIEFKLSWLPDLFSRVLVGVWAPYAWFEIAYRFDRTGQINVRVDGSALPSQRLYIDWVMPTANPAAGIVPQYDMLMANPAEVVGFLQNEEWGCQPASRGTRLSWCGQGS